MNATLLCPGPSLANYRPSTSTGIIIGVNRAATLHACDVWAATDIPLIKRTTPLGTPVLLTIEATRDSLIRRGRAWPYGVVTHTDMAGGTPTNNGTPWTRFTATAALKYAAWTGATRIDVYGADMAGELDWDGTKAGEWRDEDRWREERDIWNRTVAEIGVEVIRHGPA